MKHFLYAIGLSSLTLSQVIAVNEHNFQQELLTKSPSEEKALPSPELPNNHQTPISKKTSSVSSDDHDLFSHLEYTESTTPSTEENKTPEMLIAEANNGNFESQRAVANGYAYGENGFQKDTKALEQLALQHLDDIESPYVEVYMQTLSPIESSQFFAENRYSSR